MRHLDVQFKREEVVASRKIKKLSSFSILENEGDPEWRLKMDVIFNGNTRQEGHLTFRFDKSGVGVPPTYLFLK